MKGQQATRLCGVTAPSLIGPSFCAPSCPFACSFPDPESHIPLFSLNQDALTWYAVAATNHNEGLYMNVLIGLFRPSW